ncbi:MAG TPA: phosphoglycerate mutase family protein [Chitinophagaceae bacterium]
MKRHVHSILFLVFVAFSVSVFAQQQTTTIILLRHAEKDTTAAGGQMMQSDPPLSEEGKLRAERLPAVLQEFRPDVIFSTQYVRTRSTVQPLASKLGLQIRFYDPGKQEQLAEGLKQLGGQTVVVAGHSNSIPALLNLLTGTNSYKDLDETVYNRIYIVRITGGKVEVELREY